MSDGDGLVNTIQCEEEWEILMEWWSSLLRVDRRSGKHGTFREPNSYIWFIFFMIFSIVWQNGSLSCVDIHILIEPHILLCIEFYFCVLELIC